MVAITGLLVSPVSWSHHWIWMVMIVPLLLSPAELHRNVRLALAGLMALVVLAPYWWFAPGWLASAAEAIAPVWAFGVLALTAASAQRSGVPSADGQPASPRATRSFRFLARRFPIGARSGVSAIASCPNRVPTLSTASREEPTAPLARSVRARSDAGPGVTPE